MDNVDNSPTSDNDGSPDYSKVPADFPRPEVHGAVSGFHPKLLLMQYEGRFYAPGCTPPELYLRWDACEDLANKLAAKALDSKRGKRMHMSKLEILDQYLPRLIATKWTSEAEARYIIRRAGQILNWPIPDAVQS
jgi:hypothetical protein